MTNVAVEEKEENQIKPFIERIDYLVNEKEEFLNDLEFLADKAMKYARSKSSINTHQRINQIRQKYGLDKRLL